MAKIRVHKLNNSVGQVGMRAIVPMKDEMAAMEQLGPLTRRQLADSPIQILAYPILQQILSIRPVPERDDIRLDPQEPRLDAAMAEGLRKEALKNLLIDRDPIDAHSGLIPLRPRPNARRRRW